MGSNAVPTVNLLEYLQSRTQVDYDSLDFDGKTYSFKNSLSDIEMLSFPSGAAELGPFADCTSNQVETIWIFGHPRLTHFSRPKHTPSF